MPLEPNRALTRHRLEQIAWEKTHQDYRGTSGVRREVLLNTTEGTTLVPLGDLTDYQIRRYIGPEALEEAGDMAKNASSEQQTEVLLQKLKSSGRVRVCDGDGHEFWILQKSSEFPYGYAASTDGKRPESSYKILSHAQLWQWLSALEGAGDMAKNGRGVYAGTAAEEDDYVIWQHGTSGLYYVDRVGRNGTAVKAIGKPVTSLKAAVAEARQEGMRRNYMSGLIFEMRAGEDDLRQIGQLKRGTGMDFEENARGHDQTPKVKSFSSPGGREFTIGRASDGSWPILFEGKRAGKLYLAENYTRTAAGHLRWMASTRELYWTYAADAPRGIGFDVEPHDTVEQTLRAWGHKADEILDWSQGKSVRSIYSKTGSYQKTLEQNPSRREEPDETAARELSLYIENEYSLVGAPNSPGKAIEKNLLRKIKAGKFDFALSEKAWMYLMEAGAKKYSKEHGDGESGWSRIFNKPTRELVAHEFATTFAEENGASKSLTRNAHFEIEEFDAPAHWASAFINGDTSGLEDEDLAELEAWQAKHPELDWVVDASEESHYGRWNGLQTELLTYTAHVQPQELAPNARIERLTKAYVRTYRDNDSTVAYVEGVDTRGQTFRTEGPPNNSHMQALLARAKREGIPVKKETW